MIKTEASGRCLCGAVIFSAALPSNWVAHCHCSLCRAAHGAAFVTWVSVDAVGTAISDQSGQLRWYQSTTGAERGFCSRCGSSLFFRSVNWPGELHIALANFTEAVDRLPQVHAHYDTHVDWFAVNDELPKKS
ncbi:MAG: GFA family protein [Gammaproteobacteria bacterium]|nr:GFA family protein [Gammaproteobacteria bacterium]